MIVALLLSFFAEPGIAAETLVLDRAELAGISGFRDRWDRPIVLSALGATEIVDHGPAGKGVRAVWNFAKIGRGRTGALVFDALHRSALVRFPDAAERIAARLRKGNRIERVELVLPFRDTELWPEEYAEPPLGFLGDLWVKEPPTWHAIGWALRRPWTADSDFGPTFNASINGVAYWEQFGARSERTDRSATQFGPTEVSHRATEGRMDVTALLDDTTFGRTLGERLRTMADCGFLLRKWETYDMRYFVGGYEWGTATGGRGILLGAPTLVVTFAPGDAPSDDELRLPPRADIQALVNRAAAVGKPTGNATATMPTPAELQASALRHRFARPAWMPDWQWQRVQELNAIGGGWTFPDDIGAYARWIDALLAMTPRSWDGFDAPDVTQRFLDYADAWPEYVREHQRLYWQAWLNPEKTIQQLVHTWAQLDEALAYYRRTGDWRGDTDFYRPYCYTTGTMNFNHSAVAGALLGGRIIGSDMVMADGRHGLEAFPLRLWCWFDGTTQESLDHYYFAISLKNQKVFADLGPTPIERLMGRMILCKSVDELAGFYHPGLRSFVAPGGRTGMAYVMNGIQDGTKHIVHTLSRRGALADLGLRRTVGGMPVIGHDCSPQLIAQQTLNAPWQAEFVANMVDEKPLPFEMTSAYKMWGCFLGTPLWRRTYLGRNYGLATTDVACHNESVAMMAQWRRADRQATSAGDLSTLLVRYGINETNLLDSLRHGNPHGSNPNGELDTAGGYTCQLQHKNKAIVFSSPLKGLSYPVSPPPGHVKSLQTTIGLMNFEPQPTWRLFVDELLLDSLPVTFHAGRHIAVEDGVSYVGIIPLPSTDLGRKYEVIVTDQTGPYVQLQGGGAARPALLIHQYNYDSDVPMPEDRKQSDEVDLAYGGFIIELGDQAEYGDFATFRRHLAATTLRTSWKDETKTLEVQYHSGDDTIECAYRPGYTGSWDKYTSTNECFPYRRVNGQWPYLPPGIDRDNPFVQQGTTGVLVKHAATLRCEPGRMAYLEADPTSDTFVGYNPLPDPTPWSLTVPPGATITADGKLGMARVEFRRKENRLAIDYAVRDDQHGPEMAQALIVSGLKAPPQVVLNDKPLDSPPQAIELAEGQTGYVVPLAAGAALPTAEIVERWRAVERALPKPPAH